MKKVTRSIFARLLSRQARPEATANRRTIRFGLLSMFIVALALFIIVPTTFLSSGPAQKGTGAAQTGGGKVISSAPYVASAVKVVETPALRDIQPEPVSPEKMEKIRLKYEDRTKNPSNEKRIKPALNPSITDGLRDSAINNTTKPASTPNLVTNPIQNFDGPDADLLPALFGGRFAPPDTNAAVGPNHVVITTNSMVQVFSKTGVAAGPAVRISTLLAGINQAGDDDGDPIVLYDSLSDRWLVSQFNITFQGSSMHEHIAISKTGDPTGAYWAYDFPLIANRFGDYPHFGVWPDGYYMSTNDFNAAGTAFLGAGFYTFERAKMLVGDPTAKIIGFSSATNNDGGFLPTNLQGFTPPPIGTPNLFIEFFADEFGPEGDVLRPFAFSPNYTTPASSTLTQLADVTLAAYDARNPSGRGDIAQPAGGEGLDSLADRLMHAMNFRVLPGGVQSYVLNFTVNVSGANPTSAAAYQAGIRWTELRRNAGTGALSVNQQATYAPGSGSGTGRDLWMAGIAQDGEGNIGLAANASGTSPALNPTIVYTGRLAADPANTLPQGEVDALSAVTRGVQTATSNRWGDYSSLFIDPADECTFWGAFEYADSPTASFDWNTRIISFKVNPTCVTAPRGTINGTITNCSSGNPIANAIITTPEGFVRQSDASGNFSMIVTPGTYNVSVTAAGGFGVCTQSVTVAANGTATVNCCLAGAATISAAGSSIVSEACAPANGALDPGEVVTVSLCVQNTGGANTTNLVGTLAATGGVTSPSGPQNYGVVVAGGPAVCRNFTFTASGACGGTVTATLNLQDGATNLGSVTYTFTLGSENVSFTENFDGVTAPSLPAGWTTSFTNGDGDCTIGGALCTLGTNWATTTSGPDTAPNAVFHNDPSCVTDNALNTPSIAITSATAQLSFRNNFATEASGGSFFDGGVLEISIGGGPFTDIVTAGGSFASGGYTGTISTSFLSPIAGRQAWSGNSSGYINTVANIPAAANGQNVVFRFRMASDCSVGATGWTIDTVKVSNGIACCGSGGGGGDCVVTCPANVTVSNDPNQCGAVVNYPAPTSTGSCGTITCTPPSGSFFPVGTTTVTCSSSGGGSRPTGTCASPQTITQSASQAIVPLNSVSCNSPAGHADNRYFRAFTLPSFGINNAFEITSVDIGIEEATAGVARGAGAKSISKSKKGKSIGGSPTGNSQPVTINLYTSSTAFPTGYPGSLTLIGTTSIMVADQSGTVLNVPITATAPAGSQLVVEVFTPSGEKVGNFFFIGSNSAGETGPSYILAADCGITTPTATSAIGFPEMQIVMNVNGCQQAGGTGPSCSFTVTVNDTQPPTITCPANVAAVAAPTCPASNTTTITYPPPTASDNCPGVTVACVPPSGTVFPTGTTTVTCTATDASGNTATCSFTVNVFNVCVQDRSNPNAVLAWNTSTGAYVFCCNGTTFTGVGKVRSLGCTYTLEHVTSADRRVTGKVDFTTFRGEGAIQSPIGTVRCTISDNDVRDNNCACIGGPPPASSSTKN
jgi:hypothetical protein